MNLKEKNIGVIPIGLKIKFRPSPYLKGIVWQAGCRSTDAYVGSKLGRNKLYESPDTDFCDFFINIEFILSVKKYKKVIFEKKNKVKKFAKKADYPLNVLQWSCGSNANSFPLWSSSPFSFFLCTDQ